MRFERLIYGIILSVLLYLPKVNGQVIQIDHVIILVQDLQKATQAYQAKGFTIKPGRLHENGLLNAHIKFPNSSSIELMSLKGEPIDEIAQQYATLLEHGEGAVYLALAVDDMEQLTYKIDQLEYPYEKMDGKLWSYLTFPEDGPLASIFFIKYHSKLSDLPQFTEHANTFNRIEEVWLEGNETMLKLFETLGLKHGESINEELFGESVRFLTKTGALNILKGRPKGSRPRIKSITLGNQQDKQLTLKF